LDERHGAGVESMAVQSQTGRVATLFTSDAQRKGATCEGCVYAAALFAAEKQDDVLAAGRGIDAGRIRAPDNGR
jgi:hypothetical protein